MRFFFLFLVLVSVTVRATPPQNGMRPEVTIEWSNAQPQQRQALDSFYRALQQTPPAAGTADLIERQRHLEQLRDMSSAQRQAMFRNFVQGTEANH